MNIFKVHRLLADLNIPTIATETSIEQAAGQGENIYRLAKRNDKWAFMFVQYEKQDGKENVRKVFDNVKIASKYYFFFLLNKHFFWEYIYPFERKNGDINIGTPQFTIENLREALQRLSINNKYYSLDGEIKNHSVVLEKISDIESKAKLVGEKNKILGETMTLENWLIYYSLYKDVYGLSLLDQYCQKLMDNNEIEQPFTDDDYKMFFSYDI